MAALLVLVVILAVCLTGTVAAYHLGNFPINHFTRLELDNRQTGTGGVMEQEISRTGESRIPWQLSRELQQGETEELRRRRTIIGLSLVVMACMAAVSLRETSHREAPIRPAARRLRLG